MSNVRAQGRREPLDCVVRLVTPERIVIVHPLAGPSRRFVAYLIDLVLLGALIFLALVLSLFLSMGSMAGFGPPLLALFLLSWGYGAFCEGVYNGQTVGKRAMGIRVVSERGVPISGAQAILRNLVGTVDGLFPFFFQVALASMILTRKFQRLGIWQPVRWSSSKSGAGDPGLPRSAIPRSRRCCRGCRRGSTQVRTWPASCLIMRR
jgi:uncharacterized RDD family membrane protein YckC